MNTETARQQMIDQQVRAANVADLRVLEIMARVPRERFVPAAYRGVAFADSPIPVGHGQSTLAPTLEGHILQACQVSPGESVIEVGTGGGYLAACLAALGGTVETVEIDPALAATATENLRATGYTGVRVEVADATTWTPRAPVDLVVFSASLPDYDARYEQWLKPGGRMFVIVGADDPMAAQMVRVDAHGKASREELFETRVPPLANARRASAFVF
jgi:protein-L-isoaspartate(D-aspartate) O-methyltransferase